MPSRADIESLADRIAALLPLVSKPARYLGTEIGAIRKIWPAGLRQAGPPARWLLILPDIYEIGMSHQGLRILYDILNRDAGALAERAFSPWPDMDARLRAAGLPLFSLESRRPARDFDIIGFSLQYELLATNVLGAIDLAGLPILARERGDDDPLIAAGGPCSGNPEPLADFIDFFLIGDGEAAVGAIGDAVSAARGRPREERLRALADLPGVYVPRFYEPLIENGRQVSLQPLDGVPYPVRRTYLPDLNSAPYPREPIVPLVEAVQDRLALEIQRGCTQGCRFCQAGVFYRPVRERPPRQLMELVACGLAASGWDEVSLSSLSSADYSQIRPLAEHLSGALAPARIGLSFSSLRVDTFSVELAELVARVRRTGFTFAPEAGSQRLRDVINKRVSEEDLLRAIEAAYAKGWQRVKLYFMAGLPTESDADIEALIALGGKVRALGRRFGGACKATFSLGAFVPKAHTPFQWEAFAGREILRQRLDRIKNRLQSRWSPVRWHDLGSSYLEAVLSRGDRRLGAVIRRAWEKGARFDGWSEHFDMARWEAAFRELAVDPEQYAGPRDPAAPLPWDHIDLGVRRAWLAAERERALAGTTTPDCRGGHCEACGMACGPADTLSAGIDGATWQRLQRDLTAALAIQSEPAASPEILLRYRLVYAKLGRLRLISHLETGRLLTRLMRMAHWPLAFSRGHHPHPRLGYGPPLPLGVEGECELLDLQVTRPLSADDLARANRRAPGGLRFSSLRQMNEKPPSLAVAAVSAAYRVELPEELCGLARREARLAAFDDAQALPVLKASKGRQRTVDLKRCVISMEWEPAGILMELRLQESAGHVLGPLAALREIFRWSPEELGRCRIRRLYFRDAQGRLLEDAAGPIAG